MPPVIAAIGAGFAAVGTAVASAGVMTSLVYVGTAMTVVGAVTGNKNLTKWGSVVGLVGGLGSVGLFGEAAKKATFGSLVGNTAANTGTNVAANAASSLALSPATAPALLPGAGVRAIGQGGGLLSSAMPTTIAGTNIPLATSAATAANTVNTASNAATNSWRMTGTTPAVSSATSSSGGLLGLVKDRPEMAKILADSASGVANYLSGVPDAQLALLESQSRGNDAQSEKIRADLETEKRRRTNVNAGYMQVNSALSAPNPATAAGNPFAPKSPGLIAGVMA